MVFPDVSLLRLAKVHAPDTVNPSSPASEAIANLNGSQLAPPTYDPQSRPGSGQALRSAALDREKEEAAAEAELLDTLVGLVALRGGTGGQAPHGSGGLGAEGGSLGNGKYTARLSEGRESSGRAEESTLLNLLFVPDGR